MQTVDLLLDCRWLAPVRPAGQVLEDHAVAVDAGRIVAVLPSAQAGLRFSPVERVALDSHLASLAPMGR